MDVTNLRNFCTDKYPTLIELYKNEERWLFATNGCRAVGVRTNEFASNLEDSTTDKTRGIKDLFEANREFNPLNRQRFMVFLHLLEKEDKPCSSCKDSGRITCPECGGEGTIECFECEGSGTIYDDCNECDGSGRKTSDCDKCDGTGKDNCECEECSGSGKRENDCDACEGSGFEDNEGTIECSACNANGKIESECECCTNGTIEEDCEDCEDGRVEEDCEDCEDGRVERDCDDCDCGSVECHECDHDHTVDCDDCNEEKKDIGVIHNQTFDLALLKDLSMDYFEEISPSRFMSDPMIIKGKGVQAFIMPINVNLSKVRDRTYCP